MRTAPPGPLFAVKARSRCDRCLEHNVPLVSEIVHQARTLVAEARAVDALDLRVVPVPISSRRSRSCTRTSAADEVPGRGGMFSLSRSSGRHKGSLHPPAPWRSCRRILAGLRDWPFRFRRLMLSYGCTGDLIRSWRGSEPALAPTRPQTVSPPPRCRGWLRRSLPSARFSGSLPTETFCTRAPVTRSQGTRSDLRLNILPGAYPVAATYVADDEVGLVGARA
jgi:hypothetical protein